MTRGAFWTDERIEALTRMWNVEKLTATEIVARFHYAVSRNAVMGKIHRLGLSKAQTKPKPSHARRTRPWSPAPETHSAPVSLPEPDPAPMAVELVPAAPEPPVSGEGRLDVLALRDGVTRTDGTYIAGTCKWPVSDDHPMLFCGATQSRGVVYCAYHQRLAYREAPAAREKHRLVRI